MLIEGYETRTVPTVERKQNSRDKKESFAATLEKQDVFINGSHIEMGKSAILNVVKEHSTEAHVRRVEFNLENIETKFELQKYFYNMILRAQGHVINKRA